MYVLFASSSLLSGTDKLTREGLTLPEPEGPDKGRQRSLYFSYLPPVLLLVVVCRWSRDLPSLEATFYSGCALEWIPEARGARSRSHLPLYDPAPLQPRHDQLTRAWSSAPSPSRAASG